MRTHLPRTGSLIASAALASLVLTAGPAFAAQRGGHSRGGGGESHAQSQGQATGRQAPAVRSAPQQSAPRAQAVPRVQAPRVQAPQQRFDQRSVAPRVVTPQRFDQRSVAPRVATPQRFDNRAGQNRGGFDDRSRAVAPQRYYGDVRSYRSPVIVGHAEPRTFGRSVFVEPRHFEPSRSFYGRPLFSRPFFSFRPRFSLGFGLTIGYPVAFPYGYYYAPYDYGYGYPDYPIYGMAEPVPTYPDGTYYNNGDYGYEDNTSAYGGVTFDIQPANASVYIDGKFVGTVAEFSPEQPPMSLVLGRHHVDIRMQGYQTLSFDVTVVAGEVTPFQGTMQVIR